MVSEDSKSKGSRPYSYAGSNLTSNESDSYVF
jgi:hypothetical protein